MEQPYSGSDSGSGSSALFGIRSEIYMWVMGQEQCLDVIFGVVSSAQKMFVGCSHVDEIGGSKIVYFFLEVLQEHYVRCVRQRIR